METDFPQSTLEAQEHIRLIRREKGLGDGPEQIGNNAADLESALKVLSNDLYQTATHFLLELVQNADDNSYTAEIPTLSIAYTRGRVRIDCNEQGFSKKNIEAICRICQSTKSGRSKSAGFVGEKGIGFKAVFKVASKVWISSGHYSFRFDRDAHLGMIAPIWDKFPEQPKEGCTSILLHLDRTCDEGRIMDELQSFDEKMLLFLRRLRRLEIDVRPGIRSRRKPVMTILERKKESLDDKNAMVLLNNGEEKLFFVWRHMASGLPTESRRPGISSSEIVLAFPHTHTSHPILQNQNVYAFLPIREGGFQFLLQADFLLSANREDVHSDSPWNKKLASASAAAYVEAVRQMGNLTSVLRYTWPYFIPCLEGKTPFFESLRKDILKRLRRAKVLESQSGRKRKGTGLVMIPRHLLDPDGHPFTARGWSRKKYLSTSYDDTGGLEALGVDHMDAALFYKQMAAVLKRNPAAFFASKSKRWHTSFANALIRMPNPSQGTTDLPIIPLRNGQWVKPRPDIHFPFTTTASAIPSGIEMDVVDAEAAADPARAKLFYQRGVWNLTDARIGEAIRNTHLDDRFKPNRLTPDELVSHAEFLYKLFADGSCDNVFSVLWMAAEVGPCRKSNVMYLPSDTSGAASSLLAHSSSSSYGFLHPAYLKAGGADKGQWLAYLESHLSVSVYPRFFSYAWQKGLIHADFTAIMQNFPSSKWLTVLRDGWGFFRAWLEDREMQSDLKNTCIHIQWRLRKAIVQCTGSARTEMISKTYMPLGHLTKEYGDMAPFLDLPDPENPQWKPLMDVLHVGMDKTLEFYLACLRGAKKNRKISTEKIRHIMYEIENILKGDELKGDESNRKLAQDDIFEGSLILIPSSGNDQGDERGSWVSQLHCFWRGDSWLTQSIGLEKLYPDLEIFFRNQLLVPNAGIKHYIREIAAVADLDTPDLPRIEKILKAITANIKYRALETSHKEQLQNLLIFPIAHKGEDNYEYMSSVASEKPWLIADREVFQAQFKSILPILAFKAEFVLQIKPLLRALELEGRFLSDLATCVTEAHGEANLHKGLTLQYRERRNYLFRLMPEHTIDMHHLRAKFSTVDVYVAPKITQYWRAPFGLKEYSSAPTEGNAFLESDYAGDLRIYLRADHEKDMYPYELAEQLWSFFNVPVQHRDLIAVAMTAPAERVDQLFEARGIAPLVEERGENPSGDEEDDAAHGLPVRYPPEPSKKVRLRLGGDSRFTRLLSSTRFGPSFFQQDDNSYSPSLPPYDVAIARSTQNAIGRPVEPRTFSSSITLPSLKSALNDLEFVQKSGALVWTPTRAPTMLDRLRRLTQPDDDVGERMVSDILAAVLGPQYNKKSMWMTRSARRKGSAAFVFTDSQGRFSAFLMRLDGLPGKAHGYTRLTYHLDVKATCGYNNFEMTQAELNRARHCSVHNQPDPEERAPSSHVSVLVHILELQNEPKIRFLVDPWDLFEDGQLLLESKGTYQAKLQLRLRHTPMANPGDGEAGFDSIQIRPHGDSHRYGPSSQHEKGKSVAKREKAPE